MCLFKKLDLIEQITFWVTGNFFSKMTHLLYLSLNLYQKHW